MSALQRYLFEGSLLLFSASLRLCVEGILPERGSSRGGGSGFLRHEKRRQLLTKGPRGETYGLLGAGS
jgi:hypothetical protein